MERIKELIIVLPPIEEQLELVSAYRVRMEPLAQLRQKTQASIDRLRELRSALITGAVTGQIDVAKWEKRDTTDRRLDAIEADIGAAAQPGRREAARA
jgi:type I restriction enzyme S subunit